MNALRLQVVPIEIVLRIHGPTSSRDKAKLLLNKENIWEMIKLLWENVKPFSRKPNSLESAQLLQLLKLLCEKLLKFFWKNWKLFFCEKLNLCENNFQNFLSSRLHSCTSPCPAWSSRTLKYLHDKNHTLEVHAACSGYDFTLRTLKVFVLD